MNSQSKEKTKVLSLPTEKEAERSWLVNECPHCGYINLNDSGIKAGTTNRLKRGRVVCKKCNRKYVFGPHVLAIFSITPRATKKAKLCQDRLNSIVEIDQENGFDISDRFLASASYRRHLNRSVSINRTWDGNGPAKPVSRGTQYRVSSGGICTHEYNYGEEE